MMPRMLFLLGRILGVLLCFAEGTGATRYAVQAKQGTAAASQGLIFGVATGITTRSASVVLIGGFVPGVGLKNGDTLWQQTRAGQTFYLMPTDWGRKPISGTLTAAFSTGRGVPSTVKYNGAEFIEPQMLAVSGEMSRTFVRPMRTAPPKNFPYLREVQEILKTQGQTGTGTRLKQLLYADLDGDKREEILLVAVSGTPARTTAMLRYIVGGRAQWYTFVLPGDRADFLRSADLDGNGKMEIVLTWAGRAGRGVQIAHFDGKTIRPLLEANLTPR
jgi:hypothetical protein